VTEAAPSALHPRDRLWPAVVVSVAVHAGLLVVATLAPRGHAIDLDQQVVTARLVRLGTPRPPELLPRKEATPPPAAESPAPAPAPIAPPAPASPKAIALPSSKAPPAAPKAAAAPARAEKAGKAAGSRLSSVLSEVRHELQEGSAEGDPLGDASEAEGDQYLARVVRALRQNYRLPETLSDRDRISLTATLVLHVEADGRIAGWEFEKHSTSTAFDDALERAVRDTRLPPPPPEQRDAYRRGGLRVVFKV
jgi:colicin import membrane protein/protein TonB